MRIFENLNFDFLGKRRIFYAISALLFLAGLINIVFRGLTFGIDFKGGSEIVLQFQQAVEISEIREYVENIGLGNVEVKTFGGETGILIRTELQEIPSDIYPRVLENIDQTINREFPGLPVQMVDSTSTTITYNLPNPDTTDQLVNILNNAGFQAGEVSAEPDNTQLIVCVGIADWIKENLRERMPD
jgi:preprotein translocase subunit SecF